MKNKITTKGGLLYLDGRILGLPEADRMARKYGFEYAERLVKALEANPDLVLEEVV